MAKIRFAMWLILLLCLLLPPPKLGFGGGTLLSSFDTEVSASPDVIEWYMVTIPTEDEAGNWLLAKGSDVQHLAMALDGTLYCYANPSGTSYTLFKSTDDGRSWSYTGEVEDVIVSIATSPGDADVIYYATLSCNRVATISVT